MRHAIPASLFEGPFFYFVVESLNLLPSISASILSCCVSFIHMMIYSIMSYVPCFEHCSYLDVYYFESYH